LPFRYVICFFLGYGESKKGYRFFWSINSETLCVSSYCLSWAYSFLFYSIHY
jgi:hypothetical protein